jgi:hypothetical protein
MSRKSIQLIFDFRFSSCEDLARQNQQPATFNKQLFQMSKINQPATLNFQPVTQKSQVPRAHNRQPCPGGTGILPVRFQSPLHL